MRYLLFPILFICVLKVSAQKSPLTYVFKMPDAEVLSFPKVHYNLYQTPVYSTAQENSMDHLAPGNYLLLSANGNALLKSVRMVRNLYLTILDNKRELMIVLLNREGTAVSDIPVSFNGRHFTYDPDLHAYKLKKYNGKKGFIQVKYEGVLNLFDVKDDELTQKTTPAKKFIYTVPYRYAYLDYNYWKSILHIDTVLEYQLKYPNPIARVDLPAKDSITQLAVYVLHNGYQEDIAIVYIDHMPVYYSENKVLKTYSYPTTPGKHHLQIRTRNYLITCDSIDIHARVKNIFNIQQRAMKTEKRPVTLTPEEISQLRPYLMEISNTFLHKKVYLSNGDQQIVLGPNIGYYQQPMIIGPLTGKPEQASLVINNHPFPLTIHHPADSLISTHTPDGLHGNLPSAYDLLPTAADVQALPVPTDTLYHQHFIKDSSVMTTHTIKGTVLDFTKEPLIGATVRLKGTKTGVSTDDNGYFELPVPDQGLLEVSYIGFVTSTQELNTNEYYLFTLQAFERICGPFRKVKRKRI